MRRLADLATVAFVMLAGSGSTTKYVTETTTDTVTHQIAPAQPVTDTITQIRRLSSIPPVTTTKTQVETITASPAPAPTPASSSSFSGEGTKSLGTINVPTASTLDCPIVAG